MNLLGRKIKCTGFALLCMAACCLLTVLPSIPPDVEAASDVDGRVEQVSFLWAFGAVQRSKGGEGTIEPVKPGMVLSSGDRIKMMIELRGECFVYVIHKNPQGEVFLLFPYDISQFASDYRVGKTYTIPQGDSWFELDRTVGRETFYIFAASERLSDLDRLFSRYGSALGMEKTAVGREILAAVRDLSRQCREFAAPAERLASIGGTFRGISRNRKAVNADLPSIAEEVRADGAIFKTITIEHQ